METLEITIQNSEIIELPEMTELAAQRTENQRYVASLRRIADWFEKHPHVPLPQLEIEIYSITGKEQFASVAKAMGSFAKDYTDQMITLTKKFDLVALKAIEYRHRVCERKVVGQKQVVRKVATAFEEKIENEDIVEWECTDASLLK